MCALILNVNTHRSFPDLTCCCKDGADSTDSKGQSGIFPDFYQRWFPAFLLIWFEDFLQFLKIKETHRISDRMDILFYYNDSLFVNIFRKYRYRYFMYLKYLALRWVDASKDVWTDFSREIAHCKATKTRLQRRWGSKILRVAEALICFCVVSLNVVACCVAELEQPFLAGAGAASKNTASAPPEDILCTYVDGS